MRNRGKMRRFGLLLVNMAIIWSLLINYAIADDWYEEESGYYTMLEEGGDVLTLMARELFVDDEYIASDNRHYRISAVDKEKRTATAIHIGEVELPHIEEVREEAKGLSYRDSLEAVSIPEDGHVLLYCTHNAESYVPGDGAPSIEGHGGILDIAESFRKNLESHGVKAYLDKTPHEPHDAGAYRRSRNTAVQLIKSKRPVAAIFDIHRDATPREEYELQLGGKPASKVRIVLGKRNQNMRVNQELAYKIKAVADKTYPGLIKDIYIGNGMYNQELSPRSLLFEMGTHEIDKGAVETSTVYLADVVSKSLFGGKIKSIEKPKKEYQTTPIKYEETKASSRGTLWLVVALVVGVLGFALLSSSGRELRAKFSGGNRDDDK